MKNFERQIKINIKMIWSIEKHKNLKNFERNF